MFLKLWRRFEAWALNAFADQLANNKDALAAELAADVHDGEASFQEWNALIESKIHVSPLFKGVIDAALQAEEAQLGPEAEALSHDAPAFIDKLVAAARAEAAKLAA